MLSLVFNSLLFTTRLRKKKKKKPKGGVSRSKNVVMSEVFRRAEKASRDDDVVVSLIVKCDDICLTHILPRLNQTDLKFLYGGEYRDEKVD